MKCKDNRYFLQVVDDRNFVFHERNAKGGKRQMTLIKSKKISLKTMRELSP